MNSIIYLIFPYINNHTSFMIEGVLFKGWWEFGETHVNNFSKESENDKYHLENILKSFEMSNGQSLSGFTYSINRAASVEEYEELKKKVEIATHIIRYKLFDRSERGNTTFPQTSLYLFEIPEEDWKSRAKKIGDSDEEYFWYRGYRDFDEEINIGWPRDKIKPPARQIGLAHFDIPNDYPLRILESNNWDSKRFLDRENSRLIRAIEHYTKSYARGSGINEQDRVISLSAGFEALLNLPDERIQKTFTSTLVTMLGELPGLADWSEDFYNLRSKIVHGAEIAVSRRDGLGKKKRKKTPSLFYQNPEGDSEYISHLQIGQVIFAKCLEMMLRQRGSEYIENIKSLLVSNEVHINHIKGGMKKLKNANDYEEWYVHRTFDAYSDLGGRFNTAKPEDVVLVGKSLLDVFKNYLFVKEVTDTQIEADIEAIITFDGEYYIDIAMLYHELQNSFEKIYFGNDTHRTIVEDWAIENALYNFVGFVSQVLFIPKSMGKIIGE